MISRIYVDKGMPFASLNSEKLTDGSEVWDIHFRGGEALVL